MMIGGGPGGYMGGGMIPNSMTIAQYVGQKDLEVAVRTREHFPFNEVLPGIQWSGIYGMSMPMFTSFTVPDEYMFDILPTLKKKNYDIGEATVVTYGKIVVDIKGMTTNVEVVRALTQALGIPLIEDGDTRKLEAALKALGPADFQRAWKAQNPDKEPVRYTPADFPDAQRVIYGYRVELINGDEFVTKGERDWWRLSAAYQQAEHQSNDKDWRVVFKVQHKDA